jgi:hypothetical protein
MLKFNEGYRHYKRSEVISKVYSASTHEIASGYRPRNDDKSKTLKILTINVSMSTASPDDIKCVGTLTASVMCVGTN